MKNLLFIILLSCGLSSSVHCQTISIPRDSVTGKFMYKILVDMPSFSDSTLYTKTKYFLSSKFNNGQYSIDIPNKEILIKGQLNSSYDNKIGKRTITTPLPIEFDMSIKFKPGKYLVNISNIAMSSTGIIYPLEEYFQNQSAILARGIAKNKVNEVITNIADKINDDIKKLLIEMKQFQKNATDEW